MIRTPLAQRTQLVLGVVSVGMLLAAYTWLSYSQHQANPGDTTIPSWPQLWEGCKEMVSVNERSGERWLVVDTLATGKRLLLGLSISVIGGVLLGVYMGSISWLRALAAPQLSFLSKVVPTAALAVFFVMVGTDLKMFVTMIVFGVLPALALSVHLAVKEVPEELIHKAYTLGATHTEVIWNVVFPTILPKVIDLIRLSIGPAMVYLLAAELLVSDVGFGYRIRLLSRRLDMNVVYPYLVLLAGFGFTMDSGLRMFRGWLCPWYEEGS